MEKAGFVYYARTGAPEIKVGRYTGKQDLNHKGKTYRRLDRNFGIRHAYWCEDAFAEEKRVLSRLRAHLKLVNKLEVKGAGRETFDLSIDTAIKVSAAKKPEDLRKLARGLIHQMPLEGTKTVADLFAEMNTYLLTGTQDQMMHIIRRNAEIRDLFRAVGIWTLSAEPEMELSVVVYGCVGDRAKLLKALPILRQYETALTDLTF